MRQAQSRQLFSKMMSNQNLSTEYLFHILSYLCKALCLDIGNGFSNVRRSDPRVSKVRYWYWHMDKGIQDQFHVPIDNRDSSHNRTASLDCHHGASHAKVQVSLFHGCIVLLFGIGTGIIIGIGICIRLLLLLFVLLLFIISGFSLSSSPSRSFFLSLGFRANRIFDLFFFLVLFIRGSRGIVTGYLSSKHYELIRVIKYLFN
mmetsp:Transcript_10202/g.24392  ORF Transcript_10202/g.24392 Transcript_10202/m.24392 type:complete len:203 (-) Transcript_10202:140-748(-)